jgi:hypothetical protein
MKWTADKRLRAALNKHEIDVLWSATSTEYETEMLPIKVSLLKDLNNYRILLIRSEDQKKFSVVQNIEDLRQLKGGMNPQWVGAAIMKKIICHRFTEWATENFSKCLLQNDSTIFRVVFIKCEQK